MNAFLEPEPPANVRPETAGEPRAARNLDLAAEGCPKPAAGAWPGQEHTHTADQAANDDQTTSVGGLRAQLRTLGEMFADHQAYRIAFANRARNEALDHAVYAERVKTLEALERGLALDLVRTFRKLYPAHAAWAKATQGIGEHTIARLLASTGHPRIADPHHWEGEGAKRVLVADEPYTRNVAKFWAYCGHGDPTRKRRKGMTAADGAALGNPHAKKLAWLLATSTIKCTGQKNSRRSPYRDVYDQAREHYEERDWTDGHRHAAAIRKTAKAILKDLWLVEPAELAPSSAADPSNPNVEAPAMVASPEEPK